MRYFNGNDLHNVQLTLVEEELQYDGIYEKKPNPRIGHRLANKTPDNSVYTTV